MDFLLGWLLGFACAGAVFTLIIQPKVKGKAVWGWCRTCRQFTESDLVRMDDTWRRGILTGWHRVQRFAPRCGTCNTFRRVPQESEQINLSRR